jgi:hypothetical protein
MRSKLGSKYMTAIAVAACISLPLHGTGFVVTLLLPGLPAQPELAQCSAMTLIDS